MATTVGSEYDHVNIKTGDNIVQHYYKDAELRSVLQKGTGNDAVFNAPISRGRKANTTIGSNSVALGDTVEASGTDSHAEGWNTTASGNYSHSEGAFTTASGLMAHSEGGYTTASGLSSHAEGTGTISNHSSQHVFGEYNVADPSENAASVRGTYVEIVGKGDGDNARSNARTLDWSGNERLAGGLTLGASISLGRKANTTSGTNSVALGEDVEASGNYAVAMGYGTVSSGTHSFAEGSFATASASYSHAEGRNTNATALASHAEGNGTTASGQYCHAEGDQTTASRNAAHAEGASTSSEGSASHAEGSTTVANGNYSHSEGYHTAAYGKCTHVFGEYNTYNDSVSRSSRNTYVEVVGNGTADNARSNARTLDWSGNESLAGGLTLGKGTADETTITAAQLKALLALLN